MTNREKYAEQIINMAVNDIKITVARLLDAGILYISEEDNMIHVTED